MACSSLLLLIGLWLRVADGLRFESPPSSGPPGFGPVKVKDATNHTSNETEGGASNTSEEGSTLQVGWDISQVESGSEIGLFWEHGCDSVGKASGKCVFPKTDKNPCGMRVKLSKPLDSSARYKIDMEAHAFMFNYKTTSECPMCGGTCRFDVPNSPAIEWKTPPCPLPEEGFEVVTAEVDFKKVPAFIKVHAKSQTTMLRGDGSEIGRVVMDMHL